MTANVESMMSARLLPWHGMGTIVEDVQTAADAIHHAGLDWNVELFPQYHIKRDGTPAAVPNRFHIVRDLDEAVLGQVSDRYKPFQNVEAFEFFDTLVDSDAAKYETAGSLFGGRIVWMTAKVEKLINVGGLESESIETYLLLHTSHDGTKSVQVSVTPVRVVCSNTLNLATASAKRTWKAPHSSKVSERVREAQETLGLTVAYLDEFEAAANQLLGTSLDLAEFETFLSKLLPKASERMTDKIIEHHETTPTLTDEVRLTAWGALNSIGEFMQYGRTFKSDDRRLEDDWFSYGKNARLRDAAARMLLAK